MPASASYTAYLQLKYYPDIDGVYQRDIRLALISDTDNNMIKIDTGIKAVADALTALSNSLAAVATSGSYNDLSNKPTIPAETPVATTQAAGKVKPDGTTILIDADGTIHGAANVNIATLQAVGIVKPDGTTITIDVDGTIHGIDTYTKAEVDEMLAELSDIFITAADKAAIYSKVNTLMGTSTTFTGLGASILEIYDQTQVLIA